LDNQGIALNMDEAKTPKNARHQRKIKLLFYTYAKVYKVLTNLEYKNFLAIFYHLERFTYQP
jgi:hypothetical protein